MENSEVICQSCGMPIRTAEDCGSDALGSRSFEYCYHCYSGGKFTDEGITMQEKIEKNVKMAMQRGMTENEARKTAQSIIPGLRRWSRQGHEEAVR